MANLDNTHDALVAEHTMTRDELEDSILYNEANFGKWAKRFIMANRITESFLTWCWRRYQDEHTPAHSEGWRKDRPREYNFRRTWEQELYGKEEGR